MTRDLRRLKVNRVSYVRLVQRRRAHHRRRHAVPPGGRTNTGCARPSGSSTGCSPRRSASRSRSRRSRPTSPHSRCRDRPPVPCSGTWASRASSGSSPSSSVDFEAGELRLMVSRTGFTGDLGYELWIDAGARPRTSGTHCMHAGRSRGIRADRLAALNMARIEAGFLLPKVDFVLRRAQRSASAREPLAARARASAGSWTSTRGISPDAGRCWNSSVAVSSGSWSGSTSTATSRRHNALLYAGAGRPARDRQRHLGGLVANLQTQYCACYGRSAALRRRLDGVGGDLPESRTGLGAPHAPGTRGREAVFRPGAPARDATGRTTR